MKKFYIGDLAYLFDEEWSNFLEEVDFFIQGQDGCGQYKGFRFDWGRNAQGDGCFKDNEGRFYDVCSGTIGVVSADFLPLATSNAYKKGGQIIDLPEDFEISIGNGRFKIGDIIIETNVWEDEE